MNDAELGRQSREKESERKCPTVSVIVPTFNREKWLPLSIGSVQRQTLSDWELLVVDDGSTDGSAALLRKIAAEDPRIQLLSNTRAKGVSGARNTGIDAARGQFIAFLDSDDEWLPEHLQQSVGILNRDPERVSFVTAAAERRRFGNGDVYERTTVPAVRPRRVVSGDACIFDADDLFNEVLLQRPVIVTQTMVLRRSAAPDLRFREDLTIGEDLFYQLEVAARRLGVAYVDAPHVIYWAHDENTTVAAGGRAAAPEKRIRFFEEMEKFEMAVLKSIPMSRSQRRIVKRRMSESRFWQIGYAGHLMLGRKIDARRSFLQAIWWNPMNLRYWKTLIASTVKWYAHRSPGGKPDPP